MLKHSLDAVLMDDISVCCCKGAWRYSLLISRKAQWLGQVAESLHQIHAYVMGQPFGEKGCGGVGLCCRS